MCCSFSGFKPFGVRWYPSFQKPTREPSEASDDLRLKLETTMTSHFRMSHAVLCLALFALFAGNASAVTREISKTFSLAADGRVSLENINGNVTIEGWDQDQVSVDAVITARTKNGLDRTEVVIDASSDRIHIETTYAKNEGGWSRDNGSEVEYTVRVPRTAQLDEVELVNGSLELRGVGGDVRASLVNGRARVEGLAGNVEISTVNGSLNVSFAELGGGQRISLESVNGSLELSVPGYADAQFDAETVHGRISNDLGLEVEKGRWVGSKLRGSLGGGSAQVSLENVNGSIEIRSAD